MISVTKKNHYRTILNRSYFLTIYTKKKHLVAQIIIIKKKTETNIEVQPEDQGKKKQPSH